MRVRLGTRNLPSCGPSSRKTLLTFLLQKRDGFTQRTATSIQCDGRRTLSTAVCSPKSSPKLRFEHRRYVIPRGKVARCASSLGGGAPPLVLKKVTWLYERPGALSLAPRGSRYLSLCAPLRGARSRGGLALSQGWRAEPSGRAHCALLRLGWQGAYGGAGAVA